MNVRLQYPTTLLAGVHYDGRLQLNNYNLRFWLLTNTVDNECHNIAFERLKFFIRHCLESTVFINQADADSCRLYTAAGARLTTLPDAPVDQIIGMMLYCKLNAIMEGRIELVEIEIGSTLGENITYLHSDLESLGPFENEGWWHEVDLVYHNTDIFETSKVMSLNRSAIWRDLGLEWPDTAEKEDTGNTIIFTDFNRNETK